MPKRNEGSSVSLTYASYLKVLELTSLQKPLSKPQAHDEMLFIIIHQVYELWFKLVLFEMEALICDLEKNEILQGIKKVERISEVFRVLIQQVDILETMTPVEFNCFRSNLNPASGFQSEQFREIELLAGCDREEISKLFSLNPEWKDKLSSRLKNPSLRDSFFGLLRRKKLLTKTPTESLRDIYYSPEQLEVHSLCEHLIKFDEQVQLWRFRHVQMVERMIGMKKGTGGSLGVSYLQTTLKKRFFPELWEARTLMEGELSY